MSEVEYINQTMAKFYVGFFSLCFVHFHQRMNFWACKNKAEAQNIDGDFKRNGQNLTWEDEA